MSRRLLRATRIAVWLALAAAACTPAPVGDSGKPVTALVGGRIDPDPCAPVIPDGVVLIEDGRIAAVGRRADVAVPARATDPAADIRALGRVRMTVRGGRVIYRKGA